jgi:transcriptional antiterminator RfaH
MTSQSAWRLVYTKPRQEVEANKQLERQGYDVYLPMLSKQVRKNGKVIYSKTPLFPRYMFIHLTAGLDNWGPIRSTRGVSSLVSFGGKPANIPNSFIAKIQEREMDDGLHYEEIPKLTKGDKVHIKDGPFSGYEAIFHARSGKDRVFILLGVIGKAINIKMPIASVSQED